MSAFQPGTMVDGRYKIVQRIGSGGMADVYLSEDQHLGRRVALKVMHERFAQDKQFVERFEREAQAAAGLQHQHIVSVFDRGEVGNTYYIAMEYLQGRSLKDVINAMGALDPKLAVHLALQILAAAKFAHSRGIVHRDLKPQNVMIDDDWNVKVADFGIAHNPVAGDVTQTGQMIGTAQYISPEQAQGKPVSAVSDLYSIGAVLFEMLTGRVPFDAESSVAIALKHINEPPPRPGAVNPAVPPVLDRVVDRAMAKSPVERYASADEFTAALENAKKDFSAQPGATEIRTAPTMVAAGAGAAAGAALGSAFASSPGAPPTVPVGQAVIPPTGAVPPMQPSVLPEEAARKRKRRRNWLIAAGVLAALVLAGALWVVLVGSKSTVPNVVGRSAGDARAKLAEAGFRSQVFEQQNKAPVGEVFGQSPDAGEKARKGSTVILNVSSGPGQVEMPDVSGLSRDEATTKLEGIGLSVKIKKEFDSDVPRGKAIRTTPLAGEKADRGSEVDLYISKGAEQIAVPEVTGLDLEDARTRLEKDGFSVEVTEKDGSDDEGKVLKQTPSAGGKADDGSTVTLTVASGSNDVPDVTGLSEQDATAELEDAGFRVDVTQTEVSDLEDDGKVANQDPTGRAKVGTTVSIEVGLYNSAD
ncbi:MAG: Stk1 family PASTA domain-containing Ser/Thr kinase [Actinobacteria bacterium]|nr:Stk1 family PASTA domain-containing Ser/Thr kinase [Actinomycetota bacterium]